jgi:hypothetical protein
MIRQALNSYAKAIERHFPDRMNTVGASEIGQCSRKTFFVKNAGDTIYGAAADTDHKDSYGAKLRGRMIEDFFWAEALRLRYRDKLLFAGKQQHTFVSGFLSATPDGLLVDQPADALKDLGIADIGGDGSIVVECKSIDPRARLDGPRPEHSFQVQVQMGLIQEMTPYKPEAAVISYLSASFFDDVEEFAVRFNPEIFAHAKSRAMQILTARAADELKPEGWIAGGSECEHCPFPRACGVIRHAVPNKPLPELLDPQFVAEVSDLAREIKESRIAVRAATVAVRELEEQLKSRLRDRNARQVNGNGVTVVWSAVKGRPSFDMPALREAAAQAGIDIKQFETVGDPTDRLTIKVSVPAVQSKEKEVQD